MSIRVRVASDGITARAETAAQRATQAVMRELFAAFQQSFTAQAWDWPQATTRALSRRVRMNVNGKQVVVTLRKKRKKPVVVESPRNLIDFGVLRASGSWQMTGPFSARFSWSAQYATAVHEGYRRFRPDGSFSTWPARPWTHAVLGRVTVPGITPFPMQQRLKDVWLATFRAGR